MPTGSSSRGNNREKFRRRNSSRGGAHVTLSGCASACRRYCCCCRRGNGCQAAPSANQRASERVTGAVPANTEDMMLSVCACVCSKVQLRQHFTVSEAAKDSPDCVSAASCSNSSSRMSVSERVSESVRVCGRYTLNNNEVQKAQVWVPLGLLFLLFLPSASCLICWRRK